MQSNTTRCADPDRPLQTEGSAAPGPPGTAVALRPVLPAMRRLLLVAAVLVLLAGIQLFVFTGRTGTFFAWTIANPLTAAFLGASYWASVGIEALAARQRAWANARIAVPAVLVFTVLTLVATLTHLGQFHLDGRFGAGTQGITAAWIAIYALVPALMLIMLAAQARIPGADPPLLVPLPAWARALLAAQAAVLLGLGAALYAAPASTAPVWPWTLTPLTAQAIGAWLIGFGIAAGHAVAERDARRLRPVAVGYILLAALQAIALARYPGHFHWHTAAGLVYLVFLATMLAGTAGLARGLPYPGRLGRARTPATPGSLRRDHRQRSRS